MRGWPTPIPIPDEISKPVIPAKAGIQFFDEKLDSGLRRNDELFDNHLIRAP
jgi:hypothetical protein